MTDEPEVVEAELPSETSAPAESTESVEPPEPREPMPPVESRFMFVDISALRAKQLRRGALPRVTLAGRDGDGDAVETAEKLERIAMREVEEGLIVYDIPDQNAHVAGSEPEESA